MRRLLTLSSVIFLINSCITIKDTVVDENHFLKNKANNKSIYFKNGDATFLNPFNINTNNWGLGNIKRILLVEFEPLERYNCLELQVVENNGLAGGLVILYYEDGKQADVYHTPDLKLYPESYSNILNNAMVIPAVMQFSFMEENGKLMASLKFTDRFNNKISMNINEKLGEMQPCGLLAPIGGEAESPKFMTIVFMKYFKFLSQREEYIDVRINEEPVILVKLPVKINGVKGYQTKYSMDPVTVSWNLQTNQKLEKLQSTGDIFKGDNYEIKLLNNSGHYEIAEFSGFQKDHAVRFAFSPAIPDLQCLANNTIISGRFSLNIDKTMGIMAGNYIVEKQYNQTILTIHPTKGYSPVPGKAWMKKMTWHAEIINKQDHYFIHTKWTKK